MEAGTCPYCKQSAVLFELLRDSDVEHGGTDTTDPPLLGATWDASEKRWMFAACSAEDMFRILKESGVRYEHIPQGEGPDLIAIHD